MSEFAFRSAGDPKQLVAAVQQQVWAIDKDLPVTNVRTYDEIISQSVAERRFQTLLLGLFAALGADSRDGWDLRRDLVFGFAEDSGDRDSHGARRDARSGF